MIAYGGVNWVGIVLAAIPPLWILSEPMDPKELYKKKENHRFSFFSVHKKPTLKYYRETVVVGYVFVTRERG